MNAYITLLGRQEVPADYFGTEGVAICYLWYWYGSVIVVFAETTVLSTITLTMLELVRVCVQLST